MKNVIVTGATSMIGIALIEECIKQNVKVLAVVRANSVKLSRLPKSNLIEICECELSNLLSLETRIDKYDVFYHFGWTGTSKQNRVDPFEQSRNIGYTLEALILAKKMGCSLFVGAGSQAEYGRVSNLISPDTAVNPEIAYGIAKYAAGKQCAILADNLGINCVWARIFSVYGKYDNDGTLVRYVIESLLQNKSPELTKCEQKWDYIYTSDIAKAFFLIGEKVKENKVYCIGSGKVQPLKNFVNAIQQQINGNTPVNFGAKEYAPQQVMHLQADILSLTQDTGFVPQTAFEDGIKETINWVKDEYGF